MANTTEITIVKANLPPDHRILSLHHASSICAQSLHRTTSPTTSIYFFFVASSCFYNNLVDIVLPQMSYLSPTSRLCFDILLVAHPERTPPHLRSLPL